MSVRTCCILVTLTTAAGINTTRAQRPATNPPITPQAAATMAAALDRELAPFDSARARLVVALKGDSGTARADSTFLRFDSMTTRALRQLSATAKRALDLIGMWAGDSLVEQLHRTFLSHGIWLDIGEGEADPVPSDSTARSATARFLTAPMRAWIDIRVTEQLVPTGGDAAIGIPLDEIGRRIDAIDRLRATAPRFAASDAIDWRRKFAADCACRFTHPREHAILISALDPVYQLAQEHHE